MSENLFEANYDVTEKSRLKKFYESNKILIFSSILVLIVSVASVIFYSESKEKRKIIIADNYIKAKVYLESKEKDKAKNILKSIIFANDRTYSVLSLFLILNENLIVDRTELSSLFDHVLANNKFERIVVPFSDGAKTLSVVTNLEKAYESKGTAKENDVSLTAIIS